jgi:hypothetical protein
MIFVPDDPLSPSKPSPNTMIAEAVNSAYAPFYRQLGWAPEQREKFVAIMVEWKEQGTELFGAAIEAGIKPNSDLVREIQDRTGPEREAKLREAFGEGTVQAFQRFEALAPLRTTTKELASALFQSGAPLAPIQADQLEGIMAANMPTPDGKIDVLAMNAETVFAQAKGVLTPEQMLPFQRALENAQAVARMRRERK